MKKLALVMLTSALLWLPSTAFARIGVIPLVDIGVGFVGETTVRQLPDGRLLVRTSGISGQAIVDCDGDPGCLDTGLDGQALAIRKDLRLVIDVTGGVVTGRVRGEIMSPQGNVTLPDVSDFSGNVKGTVTCVGTTGAPCRTLELQMRLRSYFDEITDPFGTTIIPGIIESNLIGRLQRSGGGSVAWSSLDGMGELGVFIDDQ